MVQIRFRPSNGRFSPDSPQSSIRSRSLSPPTGRSRYPNIRMSSPLVLSRPTSPVQRPRKKEDKALQIPNLTAKEDEVVKLRTLVAQYERREPQLNRTIRQLKKQLDVSKDNTERWKLASQGDVRPGSHYRQEIALLKQQLEDKKESVKERDLAIENLTAHLQSPNSQNTSVCSSLVDEHDSTQSQEMERLLKENSVYAHRLLEQDDELEILRRDKVEGERERTALGKKVAAMTFQQQHEKKEVETIKKESLSLEQQVSILQKELAEVRGTCHASKLDEDLPNTRSKGIPPSSNQRDSTRTMKRIMGLQHDLRKVTKEKESTDEELDQVRKERDSLRRETELSREASDAEIKQLRNDLWKAKIFSESMEDMVAELDQTKFSLRGSRRNEKDTSNTLRMKFREMSQTIVRLQSEIRKRDATIVELADTGISATDTGSFLLVQQETRLLKTELDGALVELEKASKDHMEQQKRLQGMQTMLRNRNDTVLKLQRDVKSRTESLLKTRNELVEKEKRIDELEVCRDDAAANLTKEIEVLRNVVKEHDQEKERLKREVLARRNISSPSQHEVVQTKSKITEHETASDATNADGSSISISGLQVCDRAVVLQSCEGDDVRLLQEIKTQKEKLSSLECTIIEKDIKIEELQIDLQAARAKVAGKTCQEDEVFINERSSIARGVDLQLEKEFLERQLSSTDESIFNVQNLVKGPEAAREKATNEKNQLQRSCQENEQLRKEIESRESVVSQLQQQLDEKELTARKHVNESEKLGEELAAQISALKVKNGDQEHALCSELGVSEELRRDLESVRQDLECQKDEMQKQQQHYQEQLSERDSKIVGLEASKRTLADSLDNERFLAEQRCTKLQREVGEKEKDVANVLRDLGNRNITIGQIRCLLEEKVSEIADLISSKNAIEIALEMSRNECVASKESLHVLQQRAEELDLERTTLLSKLECHQNDAQKKDKQIFDLTDVKKKLNSAVENTTEEISTMIEESARTREALQGKNDENERLIGDIALHEQELNQTSKALEESKARVRQLESIVVQNTSALEDCEKRSRQSSEEINLLRQKLRSSEKFAGDAKFSPRQIATEHMSSFPRMHVAKSNKSQELVNLRENQALKTDFSCRSTDVPRILEERAAKDELILAMQGEMSKSIDAIQSACSSLEAKEQTIIELCATKAELFLMADVLEEKLKELEAESIGAIHRESDSINASDVKERQLLDSDDLDIGQREQSLDDIRRLIEGGLESAQELEKARVEAAAEAAALKRSLSKRVQEVNLLKKELREKVTEVRDLKALNQSESAEAQRLCLIVSSKAAETARMRNDISTYADDASKLQQQLSETAVQYEALGAEKKALDACCYELKRQVKSLKNEKASLEDELRLSREQIVAKNSALQDLQRAAVDSSEARASLQTTMCSMEDDVARLKQHLTARAQNLAKARHDLLEKEELLARAQQEIAEKDRVLQEMETAKQDATTILAESSSLKLDLEAARRDLQSILAENKTAKAETERKTSELKKVSEETDHLKMNFMRQHDELKAVSEENQYLKSENDKAQGELQARVNVAKDLEAKCELTKDLEAEVQRLNESEAENIALHSSKADLQAQVEEMTLTISELIQEVADLKKVSPVDHQPVESLKKELEESKQSISETVQAYERQISALTMNKDVTIDTLRKDLANARSRNAIDVARLTNELSKVQEENSALGNQCNEESIRLRDQRIYALEHTLLAQEKTVDSLRAELDHLQVSMTNAAEQRRRDLDELQQELSESQSNLQKQTRECSALKDRLDDSRVRYNADIKELKKETERLQCTADARKMKDISQSSVMNEVKTRLEQLKDTNVELKVQNTKLADRLEVASEKVKAIQAEKEAAVEMEEECAELRRQVKELETILESASGSSSKSESLEKSRASESSSLPTAKDSSRDSRGFAGLTKGRRTKLATAGKTKIPSVLFIGRSKDTSHEKQLSDETKGMRN
ncbi:MAG: hypothetical protein SGILL_000291 [Bacillariaceae sp.]